MTTHNALAAFRPSMNSIEIFIGEQSHAFTIDRATWVARQLADALAVATYTGKARKPATRCEIILSPDFTIIAPIDWAQNLAASLDRALHIAAGGASAMLEPTQ